MISIEVVGGGYLLVPFAVLKYHLTIIFRVASMI